MSRRRGRAMLAIVLAGAIVAGGCGDDDGDERSASEPGASVLKWPAPDDPIERIAAAGLEPARREHLQTHRHSHLDVFVEGEPVTVPAGIGIDITDPGVQHSSGPAYGGIEMCSNPCISPLHTHDETGILHTESAADDLLTLGQFFIEWGVRLEDGCVGEYCEGEIDIAVYIDGERYDGDPARIELEDRREIAIVIGAPPARIPDTADFSRA